MFIVCTKNTNHRRFVTTAHVMQEWEIDDRGDFRKVTNDCLSVTHSPEIGNLFTCAVCGADAVADESYVNALEKADPIEPKPKKKKK